MFAKKSNEPKEIYVYRIIPLKYFLQMLDEKCLYFPRVSRWEDPYELFFFKQKFVTKDGTIIDFIKDSQKIYGECWTKQKDSDALWRIYSPDRYSVQIKTSISQINNLKKNHKGDGLMIKHGKISYNDEIQMSEWLDSTKPFQMKTDKFINSLFIKRDSFKAEKEYRIIIWKLDQINKDPKAKNEDFIKLPIDPSSFIQEVILDPRLSQNEASLLTDSIIKKYGIPCPVSQSTLYKFEQKQITIE